MVAYSRTMLHVQSDTHILKDNSIPLFKTPPESPDCNPIENLWHELKHFMRTTVKPHNKEELIQGIQTFWASVRRWKKGGCQVIRGGRS